MICIDTTFFKQLIEFWFYNEKPNTLNAHLIFAITTFLISIVLVLLNYILIVTKDLDILKLNITEELDKEKIKSNRLLVYTLWIIGSFLISFILTMTEIINITIISSVIVGFTWDKLFIQLSKMTNNEKNPESYN